MKSNKILLVSLLLLAIISLGAVSAVDADSEDISAADSSDSNVASTADDVQTAPTTEPVTTEDKSKPITTPKKATKDDTVLGGDAELDDFSFYGYDTTYTDDIELRVNLPGNATGTVNVNFNGQNHEVTLNNKESTYWDDETKTQKTTVRRLGRLIINSANLNLGSYTAIATYSGDAIYKTTTRNDTIKINPKIVSADEQSVGENNEIKIIAPKGTNGNAILSEYSYEKGDYVTITTVAITDGSGSIPLNTLTKGEHYLKLNYTIGNSKGVVTNSINVKENTPGLSATVTPTTTTEGNAITVTFNGAKSKDDTIEIYVDGEFYKRVPVINGQIKETITGLSVGKHKIKVLYEEYGEFYSNTYEVTVNAAPTPTTTPKVALSLSGPKKVSKKAKKLVLKATLKINKKVAKSKKVTFIVNGKKFKAKTNKKGIAKLTIKKSKLKKILKKVKAGKKIKYQVKYSYKVNKKTKTVKKTKTLKVTK